MRIFYLFLGLLMAIAPLCLPHLKRPDGWLVPHSLPIVLGGLSLFLLGITRNTVWQKFMGLFSLALMGQACALQLIDSPPYGIYQRYLAIPMIASYRGVFFLGLIGQTLIVIFLIYKFRDIAKEYLKNILTAKQIIIFLFIMFFGGTLCSFSILGYGKQLFFTAWIHIINMLNIALLVSALPKQVIEKILEWKRVNFSEGRSPMQFLDKNLPIFIAGWVVVVAALLSWFVFESIPHIQDSISYLFQAKYFSAGHLYLPAPPDAASFKVSHVVNDGIKWYGYGTPGWPAILSLGVLAGVPWLVNPLLGGLTILLTHLFITRLYNRQFAHIVVLMLSVSPWFLFMSASYLTHPLTIVWGLLALLAIEKERESGKGLWGAVAGVCLGALFLTRSLDGILIGLAAGLWTLGLWKKRLKFRSIISLVIACIIVGSLIFLYNYALTGDATYPPQMKWADERWYPGADRLGFGQNIGNVNWPHLDPFPGHGLKDVLLNLYLNFYAANFELFGWSFGSFCFVVLALILRGINRIDSFFLSIIVVILIGQSFYWGNGGPDFGSRYWYHLAIPFIVLTIRGLLTIQHKLKMCGANNLIVFRVGAFVVLSCLIAFINVIPWRSLGKYHNYRTIDTDIKKITNKYQFDHDLVFIKSNDYEDYESAFIFNPTSLDSSDTIYAQYISESQMKALQQHFPDRRVWIVGRPSSKEPLSVLDGPLFTKTKK